MSTQQPSPALTGVVAIVAFGAGGALGAAVAAALAATDVVAVLLWIAGAFVGYRAGRALLRRIFVRAAHGVAPVGD
ncbi:hypothetical protein F0U44_14775 [Nocardioides humilatus]|uniref:Uncharacterized protein n=1 Tax=Nocardioides humilatus TaxID=2607660 RepID=A0A5B1LB89_9ACTN|nr:hypothetical protein [Nocardioides humilatus]KAA1417905.1 hypothetical protein F0U44_14775 [Nocardioides humilatus]